MRGRAPELLAAISLTAILGAVVYYGFLSNDRLWSKTQWDKRREALGELDSRLTKLADRIQAAQGNSRCDDDNQCRILGMGTKVCGLYKDFLIYSIKDADQAALLRLVSEFNELHARLVDLKLSVDQCGQNPAPVQCSRGTCVPRI